MSRNLTTRRNVLRATGGLVGLTAAAGTASAACYEVEIAGYEADVYDDCDGSYIGYATEGGGTSCDKCYDDNGDAWWYCVWDRTSPYGWVHEDDVYVYD